MACPIRIVPPCGRSIGSDFAGTRFSPRPLQQGPGSTVTERAGGCFARRRIIVARIARSARVPMTFPAEPLGSFLAALPADGLNASRIAVVVAHPDDETIGIGGHLRRLR